MSIAGVGLYSKYIRTNVVINKQYSQHQSKMSLERTIIKSESKQLTVVSQILQYFFCISTNKNPNSHKTNRFTLMITTLFVCYYRKRLQQMFELLNFPH